MDWRCHEENGQQGKQRQINRTSTVETKLYLNIITTGLDNGFNEANGQHDEKNQLNKPVL